MENLTPLQKIHAEKLFESKGPKKSESLPNCYTKVSQEPIKLASLTSDTKNFHDQNECISTVSSLDQTPLTSKRKSVDDLRKYVKMVSSRYNEYFFFMSDFIHLRLPRCNKRKKNFQELKEIL